MKPMIVDQNLVSNSFRNFFFEWVETLRQLTFISWLWVMWLVCCFFCTFMYNCRFSFSLCTQGRRSQYITWCRKVYVAVREYIIFLKKIIKMVNYATEYNKDYICRIITSVQCKQCPATADWHYVECLVPARNSQTSLSLQSDSSITAPTSLLCLFT